MYKPKWEGIVEGYSVNYINRNQWRFAIQHYDFEDLYNEAWIIFEKSKRDHEFKNGKHFMGFYKKALHNGFYDIMHKCIHEADNRFIPVIKEEEDFVPEFGEVEEQATLKLLITQAPKEIKAVFTLLFHAPEDLLQAIGFGQPAKRGEKILSNKMLCSLLGYDPQEINLVQELKMYLLDKR